MLMRVAFTNQSDFHQLPPTARSCSPVVWACLSWSSTLRSIQDSRSCWCRLQESVQVVWNFMVFYHPRSVQCHSLQSSCAFYSTSVVSARMEDIPWSSNARTHLPNTVLGTIFDCMHLGWWKLWVEAQVQLKNNRWLGVRSSISHRSSETLVIRHPFTIALTLHINMSMSSLSRICFLIMAFITFRVVLMQRSQTPPWWEPVRGLKRPLNIFCWRKSLICDRFHFFIALRSFFFPFTKLPPLSNRIFSGCPFHEINLCKAFMKEYVFNELATSRWITQVIKHVNRTLLLYCHSSMACFQVA